MITNNKFIPVETTYEKMKLKELSPGKLRFCTDTREIYVDGSKERYSVSNVCVLDNELEFQELELNKNDRRLFVVSETNNAYILIDGVRTRIIYRKDNSKNIVLKLGEKLKTGLSGIIFKIQSDNTKLNNASAYCMYGGKTINTKLSLIIGTISDTSIIWDNPYSIKPLIFEKNKLIAKEIDINGVVLNKTNVIGVRLDDIDNSISEIIVTINISDK